MANLMFLGTLLLTLASAAIAKDNTNKDSNGVFKNIYILCMFYF